MNLTPSEGAAFCCLGQSQDRQIIPDQQITDANKKSRTRSRYMQIVLLQYQE